MEHLHSNKTVFRELIEIAYPMIVSQGAFAVMTFTDRLFMSFLGPVYLSASLGGGVAAFFCLSLFIGVLSYSNALVAHAFGAGRYAQCTRTLTQSLVIAGCSIPILLLITLLVSQLFDWMGHAPQQLELEQSYFLVLMLGAPISLAKICLASYFSGIGRTRYVMAADTLGVLVNIPISYILIFGQFGFPQMGIIGAGLGTIVSGLLSLVIFVGFYLRKEHKNKFRVQESLRLDSKILRRHLRLGVPSGLEMFLNVGAFNLFLLLYQTYGIAQGAAAAIVLNWDILSFIPMIGLHIAVISLVGRYLGAGDWVRARQVSKAAFILALSYSAILALAFVFAREPMVELFITPGIDQQEIRDLARFMMLGLASYVMADAVILVAGGVLRGAGDTRWLMLTSAILHWLMLIMQVLVIKVWDYGPRISWLILVAMILSIALIYAWRLSGDSWRSPDALQRIVVDH